MKTDLPLPSRDCQGAGAGFSRQRAGSWGIGPAEAGARSLAVAALTLLLVASAVSQTLTGRIDGRVVDESGGVIPGAAIEALQTATGATYTAESNELGRFSFPNVQLGPYNVSAESAGFNRAVVEGLRVEVGSSAEVTIQLEVGEVTFEVSVAAYAAEAVIKTTDAEISTVVDNRRVLELPLNGRNAAELAMQQAGVYFERAPDGRGDKLFVHGQRHRSIQISLDGVDTQDNYAKASSIMIDQPLLALAAENVQEFKVVTGIASAEYNRGGAHISGVTRGGTNEFHGSVFAFNRNDAFSANDFFNNSSGVETPQLNRNQFGGRIGGPITKNKTFFFFGYQQTRQVRGVSVNRTVYTPEARQGNFRYLDRLQNTPANVRSNPDSIRSVNLLDCGPQVQMALGRDCLDDRFSGMNPTSLDPFITGTVFGAMPLPNNLDAGDGLNTAGFRFNAKSRLVEHLPSARIDHRFSDKHHFFGSFNYVDREINGDFINNRLPVWPTLDAVGDRVTHSRGYSASLTSTFSPSWLNEFRFGYLGGENAFLINQPFGTNYTLDLNTITDPYEPFDNDDVRDNRTVHIRNVSSWTRDKHQFKFGFEWRERYVDRYDFDLVNPLGTIQFDDNDAPDAFAAGDLNQLSGASRIHSTNAETARDLINNLTGVLGDNFLAFNARDINSGFVPFFPERRVWKNRELDWFVQDQWQLRSNLTLNLGLRWEYAGTPFEVNGLALAPQSFDDVFGISGPGGFFSPGTFAGRGCDSLNNLPLEPTRANAVGFIRDCATQFFPATSSNGRDLFNNDLNNFGPVIGFAWDPFGTGKTSVRGGFRVSYIQDAFLLAAGNLDDNEGLEIRQSCRPESGNCQNNPLLLREAIASGAGALPEAPEFQIPSSRSVLDNGTFDLRGFDSDLRTSYYNEWTFGVSREIFEGWALEVRYVGNRGVKLRRQADYNEINVDAFDSESGQTFRDAFVKAQGNLACNRANGANHFRDSTDFACITPNPLMATLIQHDAARLGGRPGLRTALERNQTGQFVHRLTQVETSRPGARQGRIRGGSFWGNVVGGRLPANFFMANPFVASARAVVNDSSSTYHAAEIELRKRLANGFTMQANYTYAKSISDYDGDENTLLGAVRPSSVRFPQSTRGEFAPRHLFKANWVYELPSPGKGLAAKVFGGWQLNGLLNWRGGRPLGIFSSVGTFHRNAISDNNTVDVAGNLDHTQIQGMTGLANIGGQVFWIDPCTSAFLGGECAVGGTQGAFELPQPGEIGSLGQSVIWGPRRFLIDFGLFKRVEVGEGRDVEFRWEVFNAFNNVNYATPETNITDSNFGQITGTVSEPRVMQFAIKLNF